MDTIAWLNIIGLCLNIIGSILLAISLDRYLTAMHGALFIHDKQLEALINQHDRILTGDVANLLKKGVENSRSKTKVGIWLIVFGFALQMVSLIMSYLLKL